MGRWVKVGRDDEVAEGHARVVVADGQRIALARVEGKLFAMEDRCSHDGGPLGEGELFGPLLECPRHGARFDVQTGRPVTLPAIVPVKIFPVQVKDGAVWVEI